MAYTGKKVAFKVILSSGPAIPCDPDEVQKIVDAIKSGSVVRLRCGLFNPSFFVSVVEDEDRIKKFFEDTKYDSEKRGRGMEALKDILADVKLLSSGPDKPRLGSGN